MSLRRYLVLRHPALLSLAAFFITVAPLRAQTLTTLYNFTGGSDGGTPRGTLIRDAAGNMYGTTAAGGTYYYGTIFKIDTSNNFSVLYSFGASGEGSPKSGLVMDLAGNLYGTTYNGGSSGDGTVFKVDRSYHLTILHSFSGTDGSAPWANPILDSAGNLYGTASAGGTYNDGVVYKIDTLNNFSILHTFTGSGYDGIGPYGPLLIDPSGNLYGTTYQGGSGAGISYELSAGGVYTVLAIGGMNSQSGFFRDSAGNLFGTADYGGTYNYGTVFELYAGGGGITLHSFAGDQYDGEVPISGLIADSAGNLWGTTSLGGSSYVGTVYVMFAPYFEEWAVHSFDTSDGSTPISGLVLDSAGNLYGTTTKGGTYSYGTVYKLSPNASITSPAKGSTLTGSASFTWTREFYAPSYQLWLGSTPGGNDLGYVGTANLSCSFSSLPTDGRTIYATLWGYRLSAWAIQDTATYVAGSFFNAQITSPAKGSTLPGSVASFSWTAETGATSYQLWLGSTAGGDDLGTIGTSGLQGSIGGLPTDGRTIYATLWGYSSSGTWAIQDTATYKATSLSNAQITSPPKGSTLPGATVTFGWTAETGATSYQIWVGNSPGADDVTYGGTSGLSLGLNGLPTDGRQLYVTLWGYDSSGTWSVQDTAIYTAATLSH